MKIKTVFFTILLLFLIGSGLSCISLYYQQPPGCEKLCYPGPPSKPCLPGECMAEVNLVAGFPLPFIHDGGLNESPTSSWGNIDVNDISRLNVGAFFLNTLFYGGITGIIGGTILSIFRVINRLRRRY